MPPNILHLTWHDSGRFYGCYGKREIQTPRLDAFAADGALFEDYWSTAPVCSPSRTSVMTGLYPQSAGVWGLCHAPECYGLSDGRRHVAHILREAGYRCPLIGWQHETTHDRVDDLGFDEVHLNDPMPTCEGLVPYIVDWLRRHRGQQRPFYLQVGFSEVHRPHTQGGVLPDSEQGVYIPPFLRDTEDGRRQLAQQQGMIRKADHWTGELLAALRELGFERDTLVAVTCDHGVEFPRAKATLYDPGIELPLILRWPGGGILGGRRCPWLLSNVDWLPTMLDLIGLPKPAMHGRSFAGWFDGSAASSPREAVHGMFMDQMRMVRTRDRKLIWNLQPRPFLEAPADPAAPRHQEVYPIWEFYDLGRDPVESRNLSSTFPVVHPGSHGRAQRDAWRQPAAAQAAEEHALKERIWRWMEEIGDPLLHGPEVKPSYQRALMDYQAARHGGIAPKSTAASRGR